MGDENRDPRTGDTTDAATDDCDRSDDNESLTDADEGITDATQPAPPETNTTPTAHESEQTDEADPGSHLTDVPDGAGCTEIWEHLSDERDED